VLNGLRHYYAVAKEKLIPKIRDDDSRDPHQRFSDLGAIVFSTPKSEIDKRERNWKRAKRKKKH
jgi:hypothetical protein